MKPNSGPVDERFFSGTFKPANLVLAGALGWFVFISFYPLKYSNPALVYFMVVAGGIIAYWLILITSKNQLIAISAALAFSAMMPFINDSIYPSPIYPTCRVIGKYYWVSPDNKQRGASLRPTYQLMCKDGVKETGGAFFPERPYEIGDEATLQKGFFNFEFIQEINEEKAGSQ